MFEGDELRFRPLRWEDGKWHIESRYPTQAKIGLSGAPNVLLEFFSFNFKHLDASICI